MNGNLASGCNYGDFLLSSSVFFEKELILISDTTSDRNYGISTLRFFFYYIYLAINKLITDVRYFFFE